MRPLFRMAMLASFALPLIASAQEFPSKPLHLIVPYPPGASTDILGRLVGAKLSASLGQPVIVENRAGASGNIGSAYVAKQPGDGYTFQVATDATHTTNSHLAKDFPYDPIKDFTPLTAAAANIIVLVVLPTFPARNVAELIEYAKKNPGRVTYGSSGVGSPHHLSGELLGQMTGTTLVHVAYKGGAPAVTDVLGGQISMLFSSLVSVMPLIQGGKLRALAVTDSKRYAELAQVPTIGETVPGFEMTSWLGFFAPAHVPPAIAKRLNEEIVKVINQPDSRSKLESAGLVPIGNSQEEFAAMVKSDYEKRGKLISSAGIKGE